MKIASLISFARLPLSKNEFKVPTNLIGPDDISTHGYSLEHYVNNDGMTTALNLIDKFATVAFSTEL